MQVATGLGATGAALIDDVDMVHFTGSVPTGKKVMAKAAETLTPVSLELGGKDPMIVLRDADVDRAANAAVFWGMANGGQICMSVERVYVEEPIYDEFVSKVVEKRAEAAPGRAGRGGQRGGRRGHVPAAARPRRAPRERRRREGCARARGRQARRRTGRLLRAHRPHRRRPLDEDHDRRDVRPDAADHEGARRGGGLRLANDSRLRAQLERVDEGHREGRARSRGGCRPATPA